MEVCTKVCPTELFSHCCHLHRLHTHAHNHVTALLDFVWGYPAEPTPQLYHQEGKTNLDFPEQERVIGSGISWAICKSAPCPRQITTPALHYSVFIVSMPFLPPNQQCQSTEGTFMQITTSYLFIYLYVVVQVEQTILVCVSVSG